MRLFAFRIVLCFQLVFIAFLTVSCGSGSGSSNTASPSSPTSSPATAQSIVVSVSPLTANVVPGGTQQYTAAVSGTSNTAVTWSAGGAQGGNTTVGTISASGLYTAPATIPTPSNVAITATSVADPSRSGAATAVIHVHHANQDLQSAPIRLGTSGGNRTDKTTSGNKIFCCSGTLGSLISRDGNFYILSNNHVLDKSDQGVPGDAITQPGLADTDCGQNPSNIVANLSEAAPLKTSNVDAAMAQIVAGQVDTSGAILDLGGPGQPAPPSATIATAAVNEPVAKSGDATGLTCSNVLAVNATVRVTYSTSCQGSSTFSITFNNQVAVSGGEFSSSGDSGSLIVTSDTARPVALLYAGSDETSVGNPIGDVLTALKDPSSGEIPKMVGAADHAVACSSAAQPRTAAQQRSATSTRLSPSAVARATAVKDLHASELMQDPAVSGIGVGQSDDNPDDPALVVFLNSQPGSPIPEQIDGVRTKVVRGSQFRPETAQQLASLPAISRSEIARAQLTKARHVQELMENSAILGVGVGASNDSPGESALVVFVDKAGAATVPAEIDGVRTRVIVTDPIRTFNWGHAAVKACSRISQPLWRKASRIAP